VRIVRPQSSPIFTHVNVPPTPPARPTNPSTRLSKESNLRGRHLHVHMAGVCLRTKAKRKSHRPPVPSLVPRYVYVAAVACTAHRTPLNRSDRCLINGDASSE
jgi:hypothetical protein